jgi:hypothetical protein
MLSSISAAQRRSVMQGKTVSTMAVIGSLWLAFAGSASAASVTATGCLAKGGEKDRFELTHATGGSADRYELVPDKGVDLNAHVGHKVSITGETASEASEQKNEKSSVKSEERDKPHPHLKVKSLRHVAAQCP